MKKMADKKQIQLIHIAKTQLALDDETKQVILLAFYQKKALN